MKIEFAHICEAVIVAENKNLSIINIFNQISGSQFPAIHPKLTVIVGVSGDEGEYPLNIKIIQRTNSKTIAEFSNGTMKISDPSLQGRFFLNITPLVLPEAGYYDVSISVGGENKILNFEAKINL